MPPTSTVTAASRARKFPEDFFVDNGKLMCHFCDHSINFQTKNTITTHIGSKTHLRNMMYFNNQNSGLCPRRYATNQQKITGIPGRYVAN
ncbi:hypothetical protein C1646_773984 [Rhizophagus diaphanus]|nr:hypothetical protein C1646_773984 [Rhizophagus diaphanus] [Rhizophagus sp. MUCL 43196]